MLRSLLLSVLLAHYLLLTLGQCSLLIPEQAHISTELVFFHRQLNRVNKLFVDEYLDRENWRSSFKVTDEIESEKIYYNEIVADQPELGPIERRFLQYDVYAATCYNLDIHEWHLAEIRRLALGVMAANHMYPRNTDIALGPSGLLLAIESRLEDLKYRGTIFCEQRWAFVDVFELVDVKPLSAFFSVGSYMLVQVEILVPGGGGADDESSAPISDGDFGKSLASVAIAAKYKLQIVNIRLCSVDRGKVSKASKARRPYECTDDDFGVPEQDLLASFDLIEEIRSGQPIGQSLLEGLGGFDFGLNPFVRPVGIGCYHKEPAGALLSVSRPKTFGPADSNQFSAEYISLHGSQGQSYVAYDGNRRVARHDRDGRMSVYDLGSGRSFHVDQFPAAVGASSSSPSREASTKHGRSPPTRNCVSFDGEDGSYLVDSGQFSPIARLLGIDEEDQAHFVGSKTIDDETVDVYELELERGKNAPSPGGFNLPIIMEPVNFVMPQLGPDSNKDNNTDDGLRFFLTYYVSELISSAPAAAGVPDSKKPQIVAKKGVKIPRFVELWQFSETRKLRSLVNVVEFTQFSWSLTVQAEDESAAGGGLPDSSRLFNIASCAQERSEQLELSFNTIYSWVPAELIRANRHSIREALHEQLASALDIPRPNILDLEFHFSAPHTGVWLVNARIAELTSGLSNDQLVGYLEWSKSLKWLTETMLAHRENRHSLGACKLDSLALGQQSNTIVYCPGKTSCLLVEPQAIEQHRADLMVVERDIERAIRSNDDRLAMCEVHQFGWRPAPTRAERAVIPRVIENQSRLLYNNFIFKLADPSGRLLPVEYRGFGHGVKVKLLDSVGLAASQGGLKSPLTGVRYLAAGEDRAGQLADANSNYAYKLLTSGGGGGGGNGAQEPGAQCRMACQMDEFCESYSFCRRPISSSSSSNQGKNTDCILSTMRLTRARIGELARILRQPNLAEGALKIEVSTADSAGQADEADEQLHSEIYHFRRDPECGLHPRDILAQFKVSNSLNLTRNPDSSGLDKPAAVVHLSVGLDECSGIANEAASMQNSPEAEFVYCPMESLCLTSDSEVAAAKMQPPAAASSSSASEQLPAANQTCFTYTKTHRQFYEYRLFSKVSLKLADEEQATKLDALSEIDLLKKLQVGQVIEGLGVEQCARDCNLDQSKCLAFDVCEFETNVTVCTLYFIRSPIAGQTRAGLLAQEERFYSHASDSRDLATLVENRHCAHFYLKDAYFQLKINHLRSGDSQLRAKLDEVEAKILAHDTKMGEAMKLVSIIGAASGGRGGGSGGEKASINQGGGGGADGALKHLALIVLAAIVGALAYLNGGQMCSLASDKIQALRARRGQRFGDHRISQLNLPAHLDL